MHCLSCLWSDQGRQSSGLFTPIFAANRPANVDSMILGNQYELLEWTSTIYFCYRIKTINNSVHNWGYLNRLKSLHMARYVPIDFKVMFWTPMRRLDFKNNYRFWLIIVVPFKIDLKSFPRSAFVFINRSSARLVSCYKYLSFFRLSSCWCLVINTKDTKVLRGNDFKSILNGTTVINQKR